MNNGEVFEAMQKNALTVRMCLSMRKSRYVDYDGLLRLCRSVGASPKKRQSEATENYHGRIHHMPAACVRCQHTLIDLYATQVIGFPVR